MTNNQIINLVTTYYLLLFQLKPVSSIDPLSVWPFHASVRSRFDNLISLMMDCQSIPALAITVVQLDADGTKAYAKGFGRMNPQNLQDVTPVDESSIFCIGDLTQTFTATLLAVFRDHKLFNSWQTPISQLLAPADSNPVKIFKDESLNNLLTLEDILSQRVPFVDNAGMRVAGFPAASRLELIDALEHFTPANWTNQNFRAVYNPSAILETLAGYISEQLPATATPWENLLQEALFKPLAMTDVTFSTLQSQTYNSFAQPVLFENGGATKIYPDLSVLKYQQTSSPADSICLSARDAIGWLTFLASKGEESVINRPIVTDSSFITDLWKPMNPAFTYKRGSTINIDSYGLGWELGTFKNIPLVHRSSEYMGYQTAVWILPDNKLAVYVSMSGSLSGIEVANALAETALTLLLPVEQPTRNPACDLPQEPVTQPAQCLCDAVPADEYNKMAGTYAHDGLGFIKIAKQTNTNEVLVTYGQYGQAKLCKTGDPTVYWLRFSSKLQVFHNPCPNDKDANKLPNTVKFLDIQNNQFLSLSAEFLVADQETKYAPTFFNTNKRHSAINKDEGNNAAFAVRCCTAIYCDLLIIPVMITFMLPA